MNRTALSVGWVYRNSVSFADKMLICETKNRSPFPKYYYKMYRKREKKRLISEKRERDTVERLKSKA